MDFNGRTGRPDALEKWREEGYEDLMAPPGNPPSGGGNLTVVRLSGLARWWR